MTREEAIKDIQDNILPVVGGKSLVMAISALRQPEIVTCEDCIYWDTEWESSDKRYHYCWVNDAFEESDFWCKNGERKVKNDGQTDFTASCD